MTDAFLLFFILLAWLIFLLGYLILRDFTTTILGSILIMVIGVHGVIHGLYEINTPINTGFSLIHLGIGLYWTIKSSIKLSNDPVVKIFDLWGPLKNLLSRRNNNGISKETTCETRTRRGRRARRT
jgi:hypothetical protein